MSKQTGRVLRRKLGAIRSRGYSFPLQSRLAGLLEHAAGKGASATLGATAEATVTDSAVRSLAALIEELPASGLFVVMEAGGGSTGRGSMGLVGLETQLMDHFVEILSGGDPDRCDTAPPRLPTAVDAALSIQVVGEIMAAFQARLAGLAGEVALEPLRAGRAEHVPANLQFVLPEGKYLVLRGNLDIGDGPRGGGFQLALPLAWLEPVEEAVRRAGLASAPGESEHWQRHMREVVRVTPLPLVAVIDRCRMTVAELSRLKVGEVLQLPERTLDDIVIELDAGPERHRIATGRLGARSRSKAVKLAEPPDPGLLGPLAAALDLELDGE